MTIMSASNNGPENFPRPAMDAAVAAAPPPPSLEESNHAPGSQQRRLSNPGHPQQKTPDHGEKRKRQRQPRNSACQNCAALKMKCVPSPVPGVVGVCERCHRMQRECAPAIPKPRKRRVPGGYYEDLSPMGTQGAPFSEVLDRRMSVQQAVAPRSLPSSRPDIPNGIVKTSLLNRHDLSHNSSASFRSLLSYGLELDSASESLLDGVDYDYSKRSFTIFRKLSVNFPFVTLRADSSPNNMASNRPMTTLAICIVAAAGHPQLQQQMVQAFRLALSSKVIVAGERSLDLLVGSMTFLAWHHHYISQQQIYQELCLLAGMATDLGLYRSPLSWNDAPNGADLERERAFLGCYYLCCGLSIMAFNKPSPMRWTDNLHVCAKMVMQHRQERMDLAGMLELMHLIEDFDDAIRLDERRKSNTSSQSAEMHVKNTLNRQKALRRDHPDLSGSLEFSAAAIHFYHRLFTARDAPDTTILIQCAVSIKEYLDDILARDPLTFHHVAIVDWTGLLKVLVVMAHVSKPPQSHSTAIDGGGGGSGRWESGAISSMLRADAMLASLVAHMDRADPHDELAPRPETSFRWLAGVCEKTKQNILRDQRGGGEKIGNDVVVRNQQDQPSLGTFRPVDQRDGRVGNAGFRPPLLPPTVSQGVHDFEAFGIGVLDDAFWREWGE